MSRPTVGITSYWAPVQLGKWSGRATVTFHGYVEGTRLAGGRPLVIPADPYLADDPDDVLDLLEAIVFVGGDDVRPSCTAPSATRAPARVTSAATRSSCR